MVPLLISDGVPQLTKQTWPWRCAQWWNLVGTMDIAKLILEVVLEKFHVITGGTLKQARLEVFFDSLNSLPGLQTSGRRVACKSGVGGSKLQNVWKCFTSALVIALVTKLRAIFDFLLPKKKIVSVHKWERKSVEVQIREKAEEKEELLPIGLRKGGSAIKSSAANLTRWDSLPRNARRNILERLELRVLCRCKVLSKSWRTFIESDVLSEPRGALLPGLLPPEGSFTAINYYIKENAWQCSGFDLHSKSWRALPTFSCLPPTDPELFKEYSVCGHGGLMCADVSKSPKKGELVVFNPLTGKSKALPPLLYPRIPVLVHISVDSAKKSYKVIVAGSSAASDEHLSKKMEVFDSTTSKWKEICDLPGPAFGLNEHQAGVCVDGTLFFISFLEGDGGKGVMAFDVEGEKWLENLVCPIPFSSYSNTLQLVESDGKVCLFSEQERNQSVEHCIDVLELANPNAGAHWRNVVRVRKSGGRGLLVYPEFTCVGFGAGKLCIFNTLNREGVVHDMRNGMQLELLEPPPPDQKGDNFFSLNPASFALQPSVDSDP